MLPAAPYSCPPSRARKAIEQPPITVTENDYDRIDALLTKAGDNVPGIRELRAELGRADVVAAAQMPTDVVTMNSTVIFESVDSGKSLELTLVYPKDIDGSGGKVSILAPVGSALLGLAVGQTIEWQLSGGSSLKLKGTSKNSLL